MIQKDDRKTEIKIIQIRNQVQFRTLSNTYVGTFCKNN